MILATGIQFFEATRQGLWADEIFSVAIATGHSLEHPAHEADPALGDYAEPPGPVPASTLWRYLEHEVPAVGLDRVIRAVVLSDTSPPLYYLLLNFWMRLFGTTDLALRLFSVTWAIASLPVLWLVAFRTGGRTAMLPSVVLLSAAPMSLHYATEGRMYSMLWFLAVALVALTIELQRQGSKNLLALSWLLVGAAGLLTHHFFAFVWTVCMAWLFIRPGLLTRRSVFTGTIVTIVAVLPWYVMVPGMLERWRVTGDWLYGPLSASGVALAPVKLAANFLSWPRRFGPQIGDWLAGLVVGLIMLEGWRRSRSSLFSGCRLLIWLWLAAACLGPVIFDLINGTRTASVPRYAIAGSPAAILLVAFGVGRLPSALRVVAVLALVLAWSEGIVALLQTSSRQGEPFKEIGASITSSIGRSDLVLVHSIPSGVLGMARYLGPDVHVASWVGQLGQRRVPDDIQKLTSGRTKIVLVKIHDVGEPAPEETWLREHAVVIEDRRQNNGRIVTFAPRGRDTFAWPIGGAEETSSTR